MNAMARALTAVLLMFVLALTSPWSYAQSTPDEGDADDQNTPAQIVANLRTLLAQEQRNLVAALAPDASVANPQAPSTTTLVDLLRADLRATVLAQWSRSSEVDLAVRRAAMQLLEQKIAAYEAAYGLSDGLPTTRLNVLSAIDLDNLQSRLESRLRDALVRTAGMPDSAISLPTLGHLHELRAEIEGIRYERLGRGTAGARLVSIGTRPRLSYALARATIDAADSEVAAERVLLREIQHRLTWNPNDAALVVVRNEVLLGKNGRYLLARSRAGNQAEPRWPPGRGPPDAPQFVPRKGPGDGPLSPSGAANAIADVRSGIEAEIRAIRHGSVLDAADAAAGWQAASSWLAQHVDFPNSEVFSLQVLSDADLPRYQEHWRQWLAAIDRTVAAQPVPPPQQLLQREQAKRRLALIAAEIRIRGPPPPGPEAGPHGPEQVLRAARLSSREAFASYEDYAHVTREERRLVELGKLWDLAEPQDKLGIREALDIQTSRVKQVRGDQIRISRSAVRDAEKLAYIDGRGARGVLTARLYRDIGTELREASAALHADDTAVEPARRVASLLRPSGPRWLADVTALIRNSAIHMPQALLSVAGIRERAPQLPAQFQFDRNFSRSGPNSIKEFRANPSVAPGGVVIDPPMPGFLARRIDGLRYDSAAARFRLRIDGIWLDVDPPVAPTAARAALGFVLDGRVAAIDIGNVSGGGTPAEDMLTWLARNGVLDVARLGRKDKQRTLELDRLLRVVRSNPAIQNTSIATNLIAADELILSAVSLDPALPASRTYFQGIDTRELHRRLTRDRRLLAPDARCFKSVLAVDDLSYRLDASTVKLAPHFDYALYAIPDVAGSPTPKAGRCQAAPIRLPGVSDWFAENDAQLRRKSAAMRELEAFAGAVALLRHALRDAAAEVDLADYSYINEPGFPSPTLLCRSVTPAECDAPFLRSLTAPATLATGEIP